MANETTKKTTKKTANADNISLDAAKKKVKDKDDAKEFKVTLRFKTAKEREKLNDTAKKRGLSTSAYLKFLIKEYPKLEKEVKQLRKKLAD